MKRKARLACVLAWVPKATVRVVGVLPADAALFDQEVVPLLELGGFVAKRRARPYQPRKGALPPERFRR